MRPGEIWNGTFLFREFQRFVLPVVSKVRRPPAKTAEEILLLKRYDRGDTLRLAALVDFGLRHWLLFPVQ
jgi:hypothetical protein